MNAGSLYAIQFDTGVIKVGKTMHCAKRIYEHRKNFLNAGIGIVSTYSAPCTAMDKREELLLKRISELGGKVTTGKEWFSGITFSDAFSAMDEILSIHIECEEVAPKKDVKEPVTDGTEAIRAELRTLNIAEVARRAGVSRQGLSRFVNTIGRGLQSRTADRVALAIEKLKAEKK